MEFKVDDEGIKLYFEYDRELVKIVRSIPGRDFIPSEQAWLIPFFSFDELIQKINVPLSIIDEVEQREQSIQEITRMSVLKHSLRPFQIRGVSFLLDRKKAFLCADMGLGKTCMSLALSESLLANSLIERTFIIPPKSLLHHWAHEIEKFIENPSYIIIQGTKNKRIKLWAEAYKYKYIIANYEQVRNVFNFERLESYMKFPSLIILDEATRIKNFKTRVSRQIKKLDAPYKVVLSGRPLENRPEELFSINQFLKNNVLGSWAQFEARYVIKDAFGRPIYYRNLDDLSKRIRSVMFRCKKEDVIAELPERVDTNYSIRLSTPENRDYKEITTMILTYMDEYKKTKEVRVQRKVLATMQLAKMYCDHPDLVRYSKSETAKQMVIGSNSATKFEEFFKILDEVPSKIVVFTQYAKMVDILAEELEKRGFSYVTVTGQDKDRDKVIDDFREEKQILVSTDVFGYGVNLQFASYIINYDLPWNPAVIEQRVARLHRMGQVNPVHVINLIVEDEDKIEQKIRRVLGHKNDLFEGIIDGEWT